MGDLSKHFSRWEFSCRCGCGFDTVDYELLSALMTIRLAFDSPVRITSGARCIYHNIDVGGDEFSKHLLGKAADLIVRDAEPSRVYDYADQIFPGKFGIKLYPGWVHLDVRSDPWRDRGT